MLLNYNKHFLFLSICISVLIFGFSACTESNLQMIESKPNSFLHGRLIDQGFAPTPIDQLTMCENTQPDIICFRVARTIAMYELKVGGYQLLDRLRTGEVYNVTQEMTMNVSTNHIPRNRLDSAESDNSPNGEAELFKLTSLPRAIYNYDGTVKYYEFGLVEGDVITATITVYATREAPHIIAFMFPYVLPYSHTGNDYYVGEYPERFYFDGIGYRTVVDVETVNPYIDVDPSLVWNAMCENMEPEELDQFNLMLQNAAATDIEAQEEVTTYWNTINSAYNDVAAHGIPDLCELDSSFAEIENTYIQSLADYLGTDKSCRDYTARPYRRDAIQRTYWRGACGPSGLAWIYRGLYNSYPWINGEYLPIDGDTETDYFFRCWNRSYYSYELDELDTLSWLYHNNVLQAYIDRSAEVDNGLTGCFFDQCNAWKLYGCWQFSLAPWRLDNALLDATLGHYETSCDKTALYTVDWIRANNLPALILNTGLTHYVVAYGFGAIVDNNEGDIKRSNLYFLVTDNGYSISDYGYRPYWRAYHRCEYYHCVQRP